MEQNHQKLINHNKLLSFIEEQYQIQASLYPLAGEVDLNFKMVTEQGEAFVVKVYAPDRDLEFLNFQERLLTHLESKELNFDVPQVIKLY